MFHRWLDRWDERRAARADVQKRKTAVEVDAHLAFTAATPHTSLEEFVALSKDAAAHKDYFCSDAEHGPEVNISDDWAEFASLVSTGVERNDLVRAKVTNSRSHERAVVVFHHWNARSRNKLLAQFFARFGITVVEMAMPYHLERSRPSSDFADHMLSANLGRTMQSVRQAVLDGRVLVRALHDQGYKMISVLGMSLGSWVAGLVAANEPLVEKASLYLTAGSLADMVWTGRATRHIRASLGSEMELSDLRRAWAPLGLGNHSEELARPGLELQIVLATRDTVVLPALSRDLLKQLEEAGANTPVLELNCGHYSLSLPPYIISAGLATKRFLRC